MGKDVQTSRMKIVTSVWVGLVDQVLTYRTFYSNECEEGIVPSAPSCEKFSSDFTSFTLFVLLLMLPEVSSSMTVLFSKFKEGLRVVSGW